MVPTSLPVQHPPLPILPSNLKLALKNIDHSIGTLRNAWAPITEEQFSFNFWDNRQSIQCLKVEMKQAMAEISEWKKSATNNKQELIEQLESRLNEAKDLRRAANDCNNSFALGQISYFAALFLFGVQYRSKDFFASLCSDEVVTAGFATLVLAMAHRIDSNFFKQQLKIFISTIKLQEEKFRSDSDLIDKKLLEGRLFVKEELKESYKGIDQLIATVHAPGGVKKLESALMEAKTHIAIVHSSAPDAAVMSVLNDRIDEASALCAVANRFNYFQIFKKLSLYVGIPSFSAWCYARVFKSLSEDSSSLPFVAAATAIIGIVILDPLFTKYLSRQHKLYEMTKKLQEKNLLIVEVES